jgi:integrase/recombinase XerD
MARVLHPVVPDVLHPSEETKRGKPRTTVPAKPQPRHVRPAAATTSVRRAVEAYILARTDYAPQTHREHSEILRRDLAGLAERSRWPGMQDLGVDHVRAFLASLNRNAARTGKPLAKATKNKRGAVVRAFLRWAVSEGLCDEAILKNVKWPQAPKPSDSMIAAPPSDLARLLAACDLRTWHGVRDFAIVVVLFDTGIRRGELLAMRLADVEDPARAGSVVSGKSGTRAIGMGQMARRAVQDYLARARYAVITDHDALWISRSGDPLGPRSIGKMLDRLKAAAGIDGRLYPHKLRHSYAVEFIRNGGNAFVLQMSLGHTSPYVTQWYTRMADSDVEQAMRTFSPADALAKQKRK